MRVSRCGLAGLDKVVRLTQPEEVHAPLKPASEKAVQIGGNALCKEGGCLWASH
jgi:hypothetical protein